MAVYGKVDHGRSRQSWTTMDNNGQQWTNTNKYPGCFMHLRCSFFLSWFFFGMFPKKREEEESMTLCAPICSSSHRKTPFPPSPQIPIGNTEATLLGSLVAQKRPDTRPKCVVTIIPAQSDQSVAVGTKSGPWGPSEDLWDLQKGHFGPKRAL